MKGEDIVPASYTHCPPESGRVQVGSAGDETNNKRMLGDGSSWGDGG